jgi:dienelactone hydrolase
MAAVAVAGCSNTDSIAGTDPTAPDPTTTGATVAPAAAAATAPTPTSKSTPTVPRSVPSTNAPATTADAGTATSAADVPELVENSPIELTEPGTYHSDLLPLDVELELTESFRVVRAFDGVIDFVPVDGRSGAFAVGMFAVDTMVVADGRGVIVDQMPAVAGLDLWADAVEHSNTESRGTGTLGGIEATWVDIATDDPCATCYWPMFATTGWNVWGTFAGQTQRLWAIEAPGATLLVSVEAPTEAFDEWLEYADDAMLSGLVFGEPTGHSLAMPRGAEFGPYAVGRADVAVTDTERETLEVIQDDAGVVVAGAPERKLLVSVTYPSDVGGFGSDPIDGPLPLVVNAPPVGDFGLPMPSDRALASHGYVVATIRFPESSVPGSFIPGIPNQPADVSFVLDRLLDGSALPELSAAIDAERIGLIGSSGGATTAFGLLQSSCCVDDRIDAFVAHAGTPYDFNSEALPSDVPILHVASLADERIAIDTLRAFHEGLDGSSTLAAFEYSSHLDWLVPGTLDHDDASALTKAFLDRHVKGDATIDLDAVAEGTSVVEYDAP